MILFPYFLNECSINAGEEHISNQLQTKIDFLKKEFQILETQTLIIKDMFESKLLNMFYLMEESYLHKIEYNYSEISNLKENIKIIKYNDFIEIQRRKALIQEYEDNIVEHESLIEDYSLDWKSAIEGFLINDVRFFYQEYKSKLRYKEIYLYLTKFDSEMLKNIENPINCTECFDSKNFELNYFFEQFVEFFHFKLKNYQSKLQEKQLKDFQKSTYKTADKVFCSINFDILKEIIQKIEYKRYFLSTHFNLSIENRHENINDYVFIKYGFYDMKDFFKNFHSYEKYYDDKIKSACSDLFDPRFDFQNKFLILLKDKIETTEEEKIQLINLLMKISTPKGIYARFLYDGFFLGSKTMLEKIKSLVCCHPQPIR